MKKSWVIIFILFLVPLISAVQVNMKTNYSQGETLIAQISGNFVNKIQPSNINLYNGPVSPAFRISFIPTVQKFGDLFYVYGQLSGKSPGNYSLVVYGISYIESGLTKNDYIIQNFTITNLSADFSINPGIVESTDGFTISAQNLAANLITINSYLINSSANGTNFFSSIFGNSGSATSTILSPGQIKQISFLVNQSSQNQLYYAILKTNNTYYSAPVFVPANSSLEETFRPILEFSPPDANVSMSTNSNLSYFLYLYSSIAQTVSLSVSDNIKPYVEIQNSANLESNSTMQIPINVTSSSSDNFLEGQIIAMSPNATAYFEMTLNFSGSHVGQPKVTLFETCSQLKGIFCSDNQTCSGTAQNAEDGKCCIGTCQAKQNNSGRIILGWTIAAIIILLVVFLVLKRYVKAKRPFNLLDFAKKKK